MIIDNPSALISERAVQIFEREAIVGMSYDPVEVLDVQAAASMGHAPTYFHSPIAYSAAMVCDASSEIIRQKPIDCPACLSAGVQSAKRIILKQQPAPFEDVFIPRGHVGVLVSSRFRKVFDLEGLTGLDFVDASKHGMRLF